MIIAISSELWIFYFWKFLDCIFKVYIDLAALQEA